MVLQLFVPAETALLENETLGPNDVRLLRVGTVEFYEYHEGLRGRRRIQYTVRPGDTMIGLGRRFGLSIGSIARINQFAREHTLRPGERIVVYAPLPGTPPERDARNAPRR